jgi:hypothetical protein
LTLKGWFLQGKRGGLVCYRKVEEDVEFCC